jgi:hypothetical protein
MINENGQGPNSEVINRRNKIISATAAGLGVISLPLLMGLRSRCDSQGESNECNDGIDINEKVAGILAFKSFTLGLRYFRLNEKKILNAINRSDHATSDLESHNSQQLDGQNIQVSELAQSQSASQNSQARETRSMLISMTAASMGVVSFVALIGSRIYCYHQVNDSRECSNEVNENFATALAINTAIIGARYFYNNTRGILSELRESFNADNVSDNVPDQVRAELVVAQASQSIEPLSSEPVTGVTRDQARGDN